MDWKLWKEWHQIDLSKATNPAELDAMLHRQNELYALLWPRVKDENKPAK